MFYMRGDEVKFDCWAKEQNIIDCMKKNGYPFAPQDDQEGYSKLSAFYQENSLELLKEANVPLKSFKEGVILWPTGLTQPFNTEKYLHISSDTLFTKFQ